MNPTKFQTVILGFCVLQVALVCALVGSVSKLTGAINRQAPGEATAPTAASPHEPGSAVKTDLSLADLISEVQKTARQEVQAALDECPGTPPRSSAERQSEQTAPAPMTVEQQLRQETAVVEAGSVVENALARGRWTLEDTHRLQRYGSALPEAERVRLRDKVLTAVNNQELSLEGIPSL